VRGGAVKRQTSGKRGRRVLAAQALSHARRLPIPPPVGAAAKPVAGERLLTVRQAAEVLQVKPRELVRFIRERGLRAVHLGRKLSWRIDERDLWAWLEAQKGAR